MRNKELATTRVRYGYRRIHVLLQREGWQINHKRTRRIYRESGLQLRNKTPKRKVTGYRQLHPMNAEHSMGAGHIGIA